MKENLIPYAICVTWEDNILVKLGDWHLFKQYSSLAVSIQINYLLSVESLVVLCEIFVLVFIFYIQKSCKWCPSTFQSKYISCTQFWFTLYGRYPHPGKGVENFVKGKGLKEHHSIEGYLDTLTVLLSCLLDTWFHNPTSKFCCTGLVCITSIANNCLIQIRITD